MLAFVTNEVPQGLVFGPLLDMWINELDMNATVCNVTDCTNLVVSMNEMDYLKIQCNNN